MFGSIWFLCYEMGFLIVTHTDLPTPASPSYTKLLKSWACRRCLTSTFVCLLSFGHQYFALARLCVPGKYYQRESTRLNDSRMPTGFILNLIHCLSKTIWPVNDYSEMLGETGSWDPVLGTLFAVWILPGLITSPILLKNCLSVQLNSSAIYRKIPFYLMVH